jgi:hypothetical protein
LRLSAALDVRLKWLCRQRKPCAYFHKRPGR